MPTAASLMVEFGATGADTVERDINNVHQAANRATGGFNVLGTAIGTAGGFLIGQAITKGISAVTGLGSSLLTTSAQAETLSMALETVAGDRADQLYKDLQKFAALTPFEFPELVQSTIALENFGIKSNETIEGVGRNWTQVIGDTAAAQGKTIDQVTQAVTDAVMGEGERLKELGIRQSIEGDKIKYTYMKNGKEMTAFADRNSQEMIAATIAGIWNDKYEGAMEKQANTFAGKLSTLKDNWNLTLQRMGEGVFDFAKVGLTHANLFFDRFNVGLDRGLNPFEAGVRALKFTLQDVFGKGPVNKIWGGMEGMFGMLATGGRALIDVAGGLKNITFGIGAAFLEGDRQQFFRQLPDWLQQSARYAGTIAEGFGDIYRAFRADGIGGAIDALFGGEGRQIANATVDLVVNAVPRIGKWLWDKGTDLATWLLSKIGGVETTSTYLGGGMFAESTSINLPGAIGVAINAAANLAGWLWDKGTDAASWLYEEAKDLGGWVIRKLPVGMDFLAKWGGISWGTATTASAWIKKNVLDGAASLVSDAIDAALKVNWTELISDAWEGAQGVSDWISEKIGTVEDVVVDAILKIRPSLAEEEGENSLSTVIGNLLDELIKAKPIDLSPEIKLGIGNIGFTAGEKAGEFLRELDETTFFKIAPFLNPMNLIPMVTGLATTKIAPAIWQGFSAGMSGFIKGLGSGLFDFGETFAGQWQRDQEMGMDTTTDSWTELIVNWLNDSTANLGEKLTEWGDGIWGSITDVLGGVWDGATNPFEGMGDDITSWIGTELDKAWDYLSNNRVAKGLKALLDGDWNALWDIISSGQADDRRATANTIRNTMLPPNVVASEDAWLSGLESSGARDPGGVYYGFGGFGGSNFANFGGNNFVHGAPWNTPGVVPDESVVRAKLELDTADAVKKMAALGFADGSKKTLDSQFKAKFDLDTSKAEEKKTTAFDWGTDWTKEIFQSTFDADNGPAALKYTDAFLWGDTWEKTTFSAKFSVDLGPLEAAKTRVGELAQEISDLLPRSPAKRGPLARPISFNYIGDALKQAMRGMARDAEVGMAALTGTLSGPVAGTGRAAAGPPVQNYYFITTPADEWVELVRKVERGDAIDLNLARDLGVIKVQAVS